MFTALSILAFLWLFGGDTLGSARVPSLLHFPSFRSAPQLADFPFMSAPGTLCVDYACGGLGCGSEGFPDGTCCQRDWNLIRHGDCWSLLFTKCACQLGMMYPCGVDEFGTMMRRPSPSQPVNPPAGPVGPSPSQPVNPPAGPVGPSP
jgi:hypothetical protein